MITTTNINTSSISILALTRASPWLKNLVHSWRRVHTRACRGPPCIPQPCPGLSWVCQKCCKSHLSLVKSIIVRYYLLELPLELGVVGHLQDALLLQPLVQLAQLAHVFIQLFLWHYSSSCDRLKSPYLAIAGNCCMELCLKVVVQLVVGGQPLRQRCSRLRCDVAHLFFLESHQSDLKYLFLSSSLCSLSLHWAWGIWARWAPSKAPWPESPGFLGEIIKCWLEKRKPIPSSRRRTLQGGQSQTGCPAVGSLPSLPVQTNCHHFGNFGNIER